MVKLFFKKLLYAALFIFGIFGVMFSETFLVIWLPEAWIQTVLCKVVVFLVAVCTIIWVVYAKRFGNSENKKEFVREMKESPFSFGSHFKEMLATTENLLLALGFMTIVLLIATPVVISTGIPWYGIVIAMVLLLAVTGALSAVGNAVMWCVVHKQWLEE